MGIPVAGDIPSEDTPADHGIPELDTASAVADIPKKKAGIKTDGWNLLTFEQSPFPLFLKISTL